MKIGVFDSGLGGLTLLKAIRTKLPNYDYVFYGDTVNIPYGNKSTEEIEKFTRKAVDFLFRKNCQIVILGCNTASAKVLKKLQEEFLPTIQVPKARILGIIVPTVETLTKHTHTTILATQGTTDVRGFDKTFARYGWNGEIIYISAPKLVPYIENGDYIEAINTIKEEYMPKILETKTQALILGCTHYMLLKDEIRKILPLEVDLISQDEIIPDKLSEYLNNHNEIQKTLSKNQTVEIYVTKETFEMNKLGEKWFKVKPKLIE